MSSLEGSAMAIVMISHCSSCPCQGMGVATPFINSIVPSHTCDTVCWLVQRQMFLQDALKDRDHQILLLQETKGFQQHGSGRSPLVRALHLV